MFKKNVIIAGSIALSLHAAFIMLSPDITSEPEVIFRKGESSLKMNLVPSIASTASTKSTDERKEDAKKVEEKAVEKQKPVQKREKQKVAARPTTVINESILKVQEKKIDTIKPVKKQEHPVTKQVKVEEQITQQVKQISYSTEYFKPHSKAIDKQIQQKKVSNSNSNEIMADVKAKGVTRGAMVKNVFKPSYPSRCKRQGHEGTTVLEVTILSKGKCGEIKIIKSAGCDLLDKAAIKALKKAKYIPAERLGAPFTTTKKIAFNFKLEDYQ